MEKINSEGVVKVLKIVLGILLVMFVIFGTLLKMKIV